MITAWLPSRVQRPRPLAGPLLLLWVAVLLFGLVVVHAINAESAQGHSALSAVTSPAPASPRVHETLPGQPGGLTIAEAPCEEDGESGATSHPAEERVAAQPQHTLPLPEPRPVPLAWGAIPTLVHSPVTAVPDPGPAPWPATRSTVIQQV